MDSILIPEKKVAVRSGEVTVRELNWREAKKFIESLAGKASAFLSFDADGKAQIDNGRLVGVLMTSLGEELVAATTDQTTAQLEDLNPVDFAKLLNAAAALNIHPEMVATVGEIVARVRSLVPTKTA